MLRKILSLIITAGVSITANAKPIAIDSNIHAVTVYPAAATVTRTGQTTLETGEHVLIVEGLPADIPPQSIRVQGQGSASVIIGSVESKIVHAKTLVQAEEQRLQDLIVKLEDERTGLEKHVEALNMQLSFIKSIGQNMPDTINNKIKNGEVNPKTWREAWENIGSGATETNQKILAKQQAIRALNKKIEQHKKQLAQIQTGRKASLTARINITAKTKGDFAINLNYQIASASWAPIYDARLAVEKAKLNIIQYGQVRQRSGEDWSNIKLVLSTANPSVRAQPPELQPWFVDILQPIPARTRATAEQPAAVMEMADESPVELSFAKAKAPQKAKVQMAQIKASDFAAEYAIAGASTIPSDGSPHKFTITQQALETQLTAQVIPKFSNKAYLFADTVYTGKAPLLAGKVSVFRDGSYIGNINLELVRPSEKIKLSFGIDDRVQVKHRMVSDERSQSGIINKDKVIERLFRTEITNHHKRQLKISLLDRIPVASDERIIVELLKKTTPPTSKNLDDRLGVLEWSYNYKANETRTITLGFSVRHPKELHVPGF